MAPRPRSQQTIVDLAQIRALADPLRLRMLGAMIDQPRTTKQVAELLGEKPTKLYHHVEALERVGLVRLVDTRPKRGTVEKYYQSVATLFQVGPSVFAPGAESATRSKRRAMLMAVVDTMREEVAAHFAARDAGETPPDVIVVAARLVLTGGSRRARTATLRQLSRLLDRTRKGRHYSLTVVACPVMPPR